MYEINTNSDINNILDIKNSTLFFKDNNFSNYFKDVFKIKKEVLNDDFSVFYDKNKIRLFAIKKRFFIPNFAFKFLLKNRIKTTLNYKIINTKTLSKTEIVLENEPSSLNIEKIKNKISDNFEEQIYFLKTDSPKISFLDTFREIQKNKIVILTTNKRKLENFLIQNNINFKQQKPKSKKEDLK